MNRQTIVALLVVLLAASAITHCSRGIVRAVTPRPSATYRLEN